MKLINLIIIFLLIIIANTFNWGCKKKQEPISKVLYFAVFPHSTTEGTYVFELNSEMMLHVLEGVRKVDDDEEKGKVIEFEILREEKFIRMSSDKYKNVVSIVNLIEKCGDMKIEGEYSDSYEVIIITKTNKLHRYLLPITDCDRKVDELFTIINSILSIKIIGA